MTRDEQNLARAIRDLGMAREVLADLCETIEVTGGLINDAEAADLVPAADPEWLDLADIYIRACGVLRRAPKIVPCDDDEEDEPEYMA